MDDLNAHLQIFADNKPCSCNLIIVTAHVGYLDYHNCTHES